MIAEKIKIPNGANLKLEHNILTVSGKVGEIKRNVSIPGITVEIKGDVITLTANTENRRQKKMLETFYSHIKNMIKGATEGYTYKLKVCYVHFPCTVKVEGDKIIIENFLGERTPRCANKLPGAEVKVAKQDITVTGADLEAVAQTAANIERAARIVKRDRRVFQDGIFITQKAE